MAQPCGPAIAEAFARARDPNQTGTSHANVRNLLDRLQVIINQATASVLGFSTLTIQPSLPTYNLAANGLGIPEHILDGGNVELDPIPMEGLRWLNEFWWRETSSYLKSWSLIGVDLMVIRPNLRSALNITVRDRNITGPLNNDADLFEFPDEDIRLIIMAAEAILLLKSRDVASATIAWQNFIADVQTTASVVR